jgi:hypothetical protein
MNSDYCSSHVLIGCPYVFVGEMIFKFLWRFLIWVSCFWIVRVFYTFWTLILYQKYKKMKYFCDSMSFHSLTVAFEAKAFKFNIVHLFFFFCWLLWCYTQLKRWSFLHWMALALLKINQPHM